MSTNTQECRVESNWKKKTPLMMYLVGKDAVKVVDVPQAVAAQVKAAGTLSKAVVNGIKGTLACVGHAGVAVGHNDLRDRQAMQDGANTAAVVVRQVVEHESLLEVEANVEVPLLPRDNVAVHLHEHRVPMLAKNVCLTVVLVVIWHMR